MRRIRPSMVLIGLLAFVGGVPVANAQSEYHQCYRRPEIDPKGACTSCFNICLGSGYICCQITPIAPNVPG